MKHFRFYQEFSDKSRKVSAGNVVAAITGNGVFISSGVACYESISALTDQPDSPVAGGAVALDLLRTRCKRIPEARARQIHPNLFQRLDRDAENEKAAA